jgi:hypothetical protein
LLPTFIVLVRVLHLRPYFNALHWPGYPPDVSTLETLPYITVGMCGIVCAILGFRGWTATARWIRVLQLTACLIVNGLPTAFFLSWMISAWGVERGL